MDDKYMNVKGLAGRFSIPCILGYIKWSANIKKLDKVLHKYC